ncbi:probable membrane-associated kinase regulator 2 [Diospyros lotus]|uniref:probable membrane-associated kinase regulator 2 n=1 Tax=Diospyros lotus TaxID=55363 RepID=UPI00224E3D71|nr:probable membrane-associated kinase regulator 2 [Diospyros lotus]
MEVFSLLRYWRGGGGTLDGGVNAGHGTTTIVTSVSHQAGEMDDNEREGDNDDGPFFDLEFAVPDDGEVDEQGDGTDGGEEEDSENERDFKFTLSSGSSADRTDPNVALSPSDDLFFNGRLVPVEAEPTAAKSQFSLLKSATKFRVMMLKFKKPKTNLAEKPEPKDEETQQQQQLQLPKQPKSKHFTVKFKVEEVPIMSLFARETNKSQKQQISDETSAMDEKPFSKDAVLRYLKMVKPLYIRVSKRYAEKLRFSPPSTAAEKPSPPPAANTSVAAEKEPSPRASNEKGQKQGNVPAGLRVVTKHLGKSRSASSTAPSSGSVQAKRRDDSLLQQQDGIQGAIQHCKRSFIASSRELEPSSLLSRSASDPSHDKS